MMPRTIAHQTVVTAEASVLSFLFYRGRFLVPWHQRYYDWSREDVSDLLQDVEEAFRDERGCYFLGAVMLVEESDGVWEINDGQQRMVTFSLICARLARKFSDGKDSRREGYALRILFDIDENHTFSLADADELTSRITPPRNDITNYNMLSHGRNIGTNGKLMAAWEEIDSYFSRLDMNTARDYFDFMMNKLEVACLFVPTGIDPNAVYETLNARGKPLDALDLIRNHVYSFFGEAEDVRRQTVHRNLENIRQQLKEGTKAEEYLRCYLQCRYGFLPKARFYREAKAKIKDNCTGLFASRASEYVYDLVEDFSGMDRVEIFRSISSPGENDSLISIFHRDSRQNNSIRNLHIFLSELKRYKVVQPIVFALLNRYVREPNPAKRKIIARYAHERLKLLNSFVMRTAFVATFQPSHFEKAFSDLAQEITLAESLDNVSFSGELKAIDEQDVFDNAVFIEKMTWSTMRDNAKAKRFLLGLAYHQQRRSITINDRHYTVEHILPQSVHHLAGWSNFSESEHAENVCRIGNLTLLSDRDNRPGTVANRDFSHKKTLFGNSIISLTSELAQIEDWSPIEIQRRAARLASLATRVWEMPNGK